MNAVEVIRQEEFNGTRLAVIGDDGQEWLTAADIGKALGYEKPRIYVMKLFNRNREEFDGLFRVVKLGTSLKSGQYLPHRYTVFNPQGAYLIALLADTPKAKALRRWLSRFMAHDRHRLREQVEHLKKVAENMDEERRRLEDKLAWHRTKLANVKSSLDYYKRKAQALAAKAPVPAQPAPDPDLDPLEFWRRLLAYCAAAYDAKREYFPINLRWYVNEVQAAVQNLLRRMDELTGPPLDARRICRTFLKEAERRLQAHKRPLNG